jgi:hypothetical protein
MEPDQKPKFSFKNVFLNIGAFISLYALVGNLIGLLFTVINKAYPKVGEYHYGYWSSSISWPVAALIVFFPIFITLMWLLEREYRVAPERQNSFTHRGFAYITLLLSGLTLAISFITTLYYFLDGQELTTSFLLKILVLVIITSSLFIYFVYDLMGKLTPHLRIFWRIFATAILAGSIVWGFAILGSPRTQQLLKYDQQKLNDLQNLNSQVVNYYANRGVLPKAIEDVADGNYYTDWVDPQSKKPYQYEKTTASTYNLCAEFNKASEEKEQNRYSYIYFDGINSWEHPKGEYCFKQTINPDLYRFR